MTWQDMAVKIGCKMLNDGVTPQEVAAYLDRVLGNVALGVIPLSEVAEVSRYIGPVGVAR